MKIDIEVFDDHVMLIFERKMEMVTIAWQDAQVFGETLERAANDTDPYRIKVHDGHQINRESGQIKLATEKGNVALCFQHTDRITLCPEAAVIVARAIKMKAQDLELLTRGVHMQYTKMGQPRPSWSYERKTFGAK